MHSAIASHVSSNAAFRLVPSHGMVASGFCGFPWEMRPETRVPAIPADEHEADEADEAADPRDAWSAALSDAGVEASHRPALAQLLCVRSERGLPADVPGLCDDYRHWLLFERAREGDAAAAATFEDYWRARLRRCLAKTFDRPAVDELTGVFFERAFGAVARRFTWQCPFTAYLQSVIANIVRDAVASRATSRLRETSLTDESSGSVADIPSASLDPESEMLAAERRAILGRALAAMPALDRQALLATLVDGESGQDVADRLGMKRQALYMRLHRAKLALREALTAAGLSAGDVVLQGGAR